MSGEFQGILFWWLDGNPALGLMFIRDTWWYCERHWTQPWQPPGVILFGWSNWEEDCPASMPRSSIHDLEVPLMKNRSNCKME